MIGMEKKAYFSDRSLKIIKNFDYTELPMVDQLLDKIFQDKADSNFVVAIRYVRKLSK